jgi:hypothetical protein
LSRSGKGSRVRAAVCFMTGGQVADWFAAQER